MKLQGLKCDESFKFTAAAAEISKMNHAVIVLRFDAAAAVRLSVADNFVIVPAFVSLRALLCIFFQLSWQQGSFFALRLCIFDVSLRGSNHSGRQGRLAFMAPQRRLACPSHLQIQGIKSKTCSGFSFGTIYLFLHL